MSKDIAKRFYVRSKNVKKRVLKSQKRKKTNSRTLLACAHNNNEAAARASTLRDGRGLPSQLQRISAF